MAKENCVDHSDYVGGAIAMANKMCSPCTFGWDGLILYRFLRMYKYLRQFLALVLSVQSPPFSMMFMRRRGENKGSTCLL